MATVIKPRPLAQSKPGSPSWFKRQVVLVPEMLALPLVFGLYLATNRPLGLALLGEVLIGLFLFRTVLLWAAGRAWLAGRYQRAERYVRWSLRVYPWSADGVVLLATIRLAQGKTDDAAALYRRANSLFPGFAPFHVGLSQALAAERQWAEARVVAMAALALDDQCAAAYAQLAQLALHLNESNAAVNQWVDAGLTAGAALPIQAALYTARADVALRMEQPHLAEVAIEQATIALVECPAAQQAELGFYLGQLRRKLGACDAARNDFERVGVIDPEGRWVNAAWRAKLETKIAA